MEGRDLAKNFGVPFFESSAKSRINVEEAFYQLVPFFSCCLACALRWSFLASCPPRFLQVREIRRQTVAKPSATASAAKPRTKMMSLTSGRCCAL